MWSDISPHLFSEFILSKKVKKNCKSVAGVFFENADISSEEKRGKMSGKGCGDRHLFGQ